MTIFGKKGGEKKVGLDIIGDLRYSYNIKITISLGKHGRFGRYID